MKVKEVRGCCVATERTNMKQFIEFLDLSCFHQDLSIKHMLDATGLNWVSHWVKNSFRDEILKS